jgi:reactive intermediate/imine deaminase
MSERTAVTTDQAPAAAHSFSQGVKQGPLLQVSGQGPVDPATNQYVHEGDVAAQTALALSNVGAILQAGGASFDDVIMLRVYLTKRGDFPAMNDAYAAFLAKHVSGEVLPARTTVFTGLPREEMSVEIDALAVVD